MKNINNLNFWKKFTIGLLLWLIPLLLILTFVLYSTLSTQTNLLKERQELSVELSKQSIEQTISHHMPDIKIFYEEVNRHIRNNTFDVEHFAEKWMTFIQNKKYYDQLRILDNTGLEILRVNYNSGKPSITPKKQLQNKSSRYYFTETIKLD